MRISKLAMLAMMACGVNAGINSDIRANEINLVSHCAQKGCDCGEPVCGCEPVAPTCDTGICDGGCDGGCDSAGCGCGSGSGCGVGSILTGGDCCLGDPWTLFGEHNGWSAGGWIQMGYHSDALPLFNSRPDELQLHQAWLYAEKAIDTSNGFDIGGRIDYLYGTDSQDTQAFGIDNDHWDNGWDNGPDYGHAMPQLYMEAGYGDLSVKVGHFYTIIGWEVVQATGNFFYSHAYTMYNSEPFTHTGALATYNVNDNVTAYGGYVMGWDSGFEDNGDAFLGGLSVGLTDDLTVTYATVGGVFANNQNAYEQGYMHSIVADLALSDKLQYIFQSDVLDTEDRAGATARETFDINQYLIYTINDCWSYGTRFEWYDAKSGVLAGNDVDVYALTAGVNYKPHANVTVRPEIRYDWVEGNPTGILENNDDEQWTFGVDSIFTF
ncbi:porin [Novipirellula sp.]|uniref:porin n=1 Tax=Novipirellula sp. TaxID=2795430 RepID=UPI0035620C25